MESWLWSGIVLLGCGIVILLIKIYYLKKSAKEIRNAFERLMMTDTNAVIDISSRDADMRRLAGSINVQLKQFYKKRQRYERGDIELKEAITNISHDLRTPLTAIYAYLNLLKTEEKNETVSQYLNKIENRTDVLKQLTEELFKYTVSVSDAEHFTYENVVINQALEDCVSSYYAVIKKCHIVPHIEMPEKKVKCCLDKNALSRILENILSNVVKYSSGDLHISLQEDGKITFSNHTAELTETQVARLFDRFYTVNTARQSTGIGLSIAKVLVEQMKGTISASYENNMLTIRIDFSKPLVL